MAATTFRQHLTRTFSAGFYSGSALTATAPYKWDVALNGTGYMIDTKYIDQFTDASVKLQRTTSDTNPEVGENSVNPESLWLRSRSMWHYGAGQPHLDQPYAYFSAPPAGTASNRAKFRTSKGVNVWTQGQVSLLNDTDQKVVSSNTNLRLCPAGARLYFIDGTAAKYTTDVTADTPSLTTVTSSGSNSKTSVVSDGYTVWFTDGSDVYSTNTGTSAASVYNTLDCTLLGYVNGRLMAANGAAIYNITSGSVPSALYTQANTNFTWVGFAEGPSALYAAGYSGDKSIIYRVPLRPDATSLDQPVVAGTLPDGEIIRSIVGYLGFLCIGTDKGWRYATLDAQGNLQLGGNVSTPAAVQCFEGQDRFVWFGYTNYDGTSTGLGRLDLSIWGDDTKQIPAYAGDLMVTAQGAVLDVCTFQSIRVMAISASGIWGENTAQLVASGSLDGGYSDYGIAEDKVALEFDIAYAPTFSGTCAISIAVAGSSTFATIGTDTVAGTEHNAFSVGELRSTKFEVRLTLTRDAVVTNGPAVTGWTLKSQPAPSLVTMRTVPLRVYDVVATVDGGNAYMKPGDRFAEIKGLNADREIVVYQFAGQSSSVLIEDYQIIYDQPAHDKAQGWNGTAIVQLKEIL